MSATRLAWSRPKSATRKAFERAATGLHAHLAAEVYPLQTVGTGERKVQRSLSHDGDLNPSWQQLDLLLEERPGTVLRELCAAAGWSEPTPLPEPEAASSARLADALERISSELEEIRGEINRKPVRRPPRTSEVA